MYQVTFNGNCKYSVNNLGLARLIAARGKEDGFITHIYQIKNGVAIDCE